MDRRDKNLRNHHSADNTIKVDNDKQKLYLVQTHKHSKNVIQGYFSGKGVYSTQTFWNGNDASVYPYEIYVVHNNVIIYIDKVKKQTYILELDTSTEIHKISF